MNSGGTTDGCAAGRRAAADSPIAEAVELVNEADRLVFDILKPGRWPQRRTVERFLGDDRLERVLLLYLRAMRLDPDEAAYPWNLASVLNRLGLNDLSLGFMTRAIHAVPRTESVTKTGVGRTPTSHWLRSRSTLTSATSR
jgi:tetratricopeptide (TPR) repeat protein